MQKQSHGLITVCNHCI